MADNLLLSIQSTKIVCNSQIPTLCDNLYLCLLFFRCVSYPCYIRSINIQPLHVRIRRTKSMDSSNCQNNHSNREKEEKKWKWNEYCHLAIECLWIMSLLVLSCAIFISLRFIWSPQFFSFFLGFYQWGNSTLPKLRSIMR